MATTIGVMGGMGPGASLDFHAKLLRLARAAGIQDELRILIDSDPTVPDRNRAMAGRGESPGPHLARMAAGLERAGADLIVMACNAAHSWQADIQAAISKPFLGIIDAAVSEATRLNPRRVGLLAVDATIQAGLYQRAFGAVGVETVHPDQQEFMAVLYRVKAGNTGTEEAEAMRRLADSLEGIDVLLAACTEVPLVLSHYHLPLVDAGEVLARQALDLAATMVAATLDQ